MQANICQIIIFSDLFFVGDFVTDYYPMGWKSPFLTTIWEKFGSPTAIILVGIYHNPTGTACFLPGGWLPGRTYFWNFSQASWRVANPRKFWHSKPARIRFTKTPRELWNELRDSAFQENNSEVEFWWHSIFVLEFSLRTLGKMSNLTVFVYIFFLVAGWKSTN